MPIKNEKPLSDFEVFHPPAGYFKESNAEYQRAEFQAKHSAKLNIFNLKVRHSRSDRTVEFLHKLISTVKRGF